MNDDFIDDDAVIGELYDELMKDYELDPSMTFDEILHEMFAYGFEAAMSLAEDDDEDEEED